MNHEDAAFVASLRRQAYELAAVGARLARARHQLIPDPAPTWQGPARVGFDAAVQVLAHAVTLATDDVHSAHRETLLTIAKLERYE